MEKTAFVNPYQDSFALSLLYESSNGVYRYSLVLDEVKQDFHSVRCLFSPDLEFVLPFGYDGDYSLVKEKEDADQAAGKMVGFNLHFSSSVKIVSLYGWFQSDEQTLRFTYTSSDKE